MGLKVFWTAFAKKQLKIIFEYYKENTSKTVARKIIIGIVNETIILKKQPFQGQIEELLKSNSREIRYFIYKNYKLIYWFNNSKNQIEILDVFDTRQNPTKIDREK